MFPTQRPRRLRQNSAIRDMVRETGLQLSHIIAPLFIVPGQQVKKPIASMPGQFQMSADLAAEEALSLHKMGVKGVLLFGLPEHKDATGSSSWQTDGVVQRGIQQIKQACPELLVMADLCFCEYTDHGHCGALHHHDVDNDQTLELTEQQTLSLAKAGADVIAPSGMMDGVVNTIRTCLDNHDFTSTIIMAYSAKYASGYYGPFRDAVESAPSFGDRRTYQMDPANSIEALREIELDIQEGADIVMVKPALAYLDIIQQAKQQFTTPVAAYNVSGEYSMIKCAAENGLIDEAAVIYETLLSMRRAGADIIISYFARDLFEILN